MSMVSRPVRSLPSLQNSAKGSLAFTASKTTCAPAHGTALCIAHLLLIEVVQAPCQRRMFPPQQHKTHAMPVQGLACGPENLNRCVIDNTHAQGARYLGAESSQYGHVHPIQAFPIGLSNDPAADLMHRRLPTQHFGQCQPQEDGKCAMHGQTQHKCASVDTPASITLSTCPGLTKANETAYWVMTGWMKDWNRRLVVKHSPFLE